MFPLTLPSLSIIGIIQILCIFHAVKTGRTSPWLYLLLFLPGISVILYLFLEILPDPTAYPFGLQIHEFWQKLKNPRPSLNDLEDAAQIPTVTNLENLADAYANSKQPDKAIYYYRKALKKEPDAYPDLHRKLAHILFDSNRLKEARTELKIVSQSEDSKPDDDVFLARTLILLGEREVAKKLFEKAVPHSLHLASYYHYAKVLQEDGEKAALEQLIKTAETTLKELTPRLQRQEKIWMKRIHELY